MLVCTLCYALHKTTFTSMQNSKASVATDLAEVSNADCHTTET